MDQRVATSLQIAAASVAGALTAYVVMHTAPARSVVEERRYVEVREAPGGVAVIAEGRAVQDGGAPDLAQVHPTASSPPGADPEPSAGGDPLDRTPEERLAARLRIEQRHAERVAEHYRQPIDLVWSRDSEATILPRLEQIIAPNEGMSVVSVDCRTTTCAALIEWPSYEYASQHWMRLVTRTVGVNCEQHIVLPVPEDPTAPYQATMLMRECVGR